MTADQDDKPAAGRFAKRRTTHKAEAAKSKADMSNWRVKMNPANLKFTDDLKRKYCSFLAKTSHKAQAAKSVGMTVAAVLHHREIDPDFNAAVEEAMAEYADTVHELALKLMKGVQRPIIGGKDKDEIVAYETVHATNLVAMEMKRTDPSYKERQEIDLNAKGTGVLVAPAGLTIEQSMQQAAEHNARNTKEPGSDE